MAQQSPETSVCLHTWKTELWLSARTPPTPRMRQWLAAVLHDEVTELDQVASRFRADSQLCAVNRNAGRWTAVSWDFVTVLTACLHAAAATDGLVDPLLGRQIVAAGYDQWAGQDSGVDASVADPLLRSWVRPDPDRHVVGRSAGGAARNFVTQRPGGSAPSSRSRREGAEDTWPATGLSTQPRMNQIRLRYGPLGSHWQEIEVRPGAGAAQVRIPPDSALDLGAVAKGWLADRLARIVHTSTGFDVVANMGGDLRVISPDQPWTVAADPDVPGIEACAMEVTDAGLATSGTGHRAWTGGHHIIDPRTGLPADTCWSSVSVLAAEAAGANTAATAGLVLGVDGPAWLAGMGLDGWFVSRQDSGMQPDQHRVGPWPTGPRQDLARA